MIPRLVSRKLAALWRVAAPLTLLAVASSPASADQGTASHQGDDLEHHLRVQTQALLDAVGSGDKAVWDRLLDPRAVYVTEAGEVLSKDGLLAQLAPLPPGLVGELRVASFTLLVHADIAIATHEDHERLEYHGQLLRTRFRTTDTWRRTPAGWRVVATQVLAISEDPPAIRLPPAALEEYVGTYRLTPEITYTIRREGEQLYGRRSGREESALHVEAHDVLFVAGQPRSRKVMVRDAQGRVTALADRREGHDILWRRLSP